MNMALMTAVHWLPENVKPSRVGLSQGSQQWGESHNANICIPCLLYDLESRIQIIMWLVSPSDLGTEKATHLIQLYPNCRSCKFSPLHDRTSIDLALGSLQRSYVLSLCTSRISCRHWAELSSKKRIYWQSWEQSSGNARWTILI